MSDLKGKKDRLLEESEHPQERLVAYPGAPGHPSDAHDERHDSKKMSRSSSFPYPDDWYNNPAMLDPMENPSELWLKRDHKRDLAFRPAETALLEGKVDAIYTQSKVFQHLSGSNGRTRCDRGSVPVPGLEAAGGQHPRCHHLH